MKLWGPTLTPNARDYAASAVSMPVQRLIATTLAALACMLAMPALAASARLSGSIDDYTVTETPYGVKFVLKANPLQVRLPPPDVDRFYFDDDYYVMADGKLVPHQPPSCPTPEPVTVKPDLVPLNAALGHIASGYAVEARGFDQIARGDQSAGLETVARGARQVAEAMKALATAKAGLGL